MAARKLVGVALVALAGVAGPARSCGPEFPEAVFVSQRHPDPPLAAFASGRLGILLPTYYQRYLYVAYRSLAGHPLTAAEAERALSIAASETSDGSADPQEWLRARDETLGEQHRGWLSTECSMQMGDQWLYFTSIYGDAIRTAVATLRDRVRREGGTTPAVRDWIHAQDEVFAACAAPSSPPEPAPAGSPAWLVQDRAYQTAAYQFYAAHYDEAIAGFRSIAADRRSPWNTIAPYLVGRSYLRKGTVTGGYRSTDSGALREAEHQFQTLMRSGDPKLRPSAERLLDYTRFRLYPRDRLGELGRALLAERPGERVGALTLDFTTLLDRFQQASVESLAATNPDYELADWILTFQAGDHEHAFARWRATKSVPWLVAALTSTPLGDPNTQTLVDAARATRPSDPAYASARFHIERLRPESTDPLREAEAFPPSSRNLVEALELPRSRSFGEVLLWSQRLPAGVSTWLEARSEPIPQPDSDAPFFDTDGVLIFNRWTPLDRLVAASEKVSDSLRDDVALAAWTKAILLDRDDVALKLAPSLASAHPALASNLSAYRAAPATERPFAAAWLVLHAPGMSPWLRWGVGRQEPPQERSAFRDNWWCVSDDNQSFWFIAPPDRDDMITDWVRSPGWDTKLAEAIFTPTERSTAKTELDRLLKLGPAPNVLCARTLAWAKSHPRDSRLAEALHLCVMATRYGCADKKTTQWSKQAYQTLHRRFPNSSWAKRTRFWY